MCLHFLVLVRLVTLVQIRTLCPCKHDGATSHNHHNQSQVSLSDWILILSLRLTQQPDEKMQVLLDAHAA